MAKSGFTEYLRLPCLRDESTDEQRASGWVVPIHRDAEATDGLMSQLEDLPSGSHWVCPRCGTPTSEAIWCSECGLNLRQQSELPTADAFAARIREERWLAVKETERRAEHEARQREAAAAREEERAEAEQRRVAERERKQAQKQARASRASRSKRSKSVVIGVALLLLATGGVIAYVLEGDGEAGPASAGPERPVSPAGQGGSAEASESGTCETTTIDGVRVARAEGFDDCETAADLASQTVLADGFLQTDEVLCRWGQGGTEEQIVDGEPLIPGFCTRPGDDTEATFLAQRGELSEENLEGPESCADFEPGPFVMGVEVIGVGCAEATEFIRSWELEGPLGTGECTDSEGFAVYPCEYQGWTCEGIQSGYETSSFDCSRGDQSIRWQSGV